jgi:hypothetical protein
MYWKSILLYSDLFLRDLLNSLKQNKMFSLRITNFENFKQIEDLNKPFLFNCLGWTSL